MMPRGLTVPDHLPPYYSVALAALVVAIDYSVAPGTEFPGLFFLPVLVGAWYGGRTWGVILSLLPFAHVMNIWLVGAPEGLYVVTISAVVRVVALLPIAIWIAAAGASHRALTREVALLEGLLPICAYCKKIRDDAGEWQMLEKYIEERTDATFTHGICEACGKAEEAAWKRA